MTTLTAITYVITRSISHHEIVLLVVADPQLALASLAHDADVTELDHAVENNGDLDVWGKRRGEDFRLRIRGEVS